MHQYQINDLKHTLFSVDAPGIDSQTQMGGPLSVVYGKTLPSNISSGNYNLLQARHFYKAEARAGDG